MSPISDWAALLSAPRLTAATLSSGEIPRSPGVYAWLQDGECVYVGKASNLRTRLSTHLSTSLDLSRSTLRASVAVKTLGVTRKHTRSRPTVMTPEQIACRQRMVRNRRDQLARVRDARGCSLA